RFQGRQNLLGEGGRLFLAIHIGTHGDVGQAIAVPDDAFLEAVLQRRHLRKRHTAATVGRYRQTRQQAQRLALLRRTALENLDQLVTFPILTDAGAGQRALQEARQLGGIDPQRPRTVLIDVENHHLARLFPVQMYVHHMRVLAHLVRNLTCQGTHLVDMLAADAELDRIAYGRAVFQTTDAAAQRREFVDHHLDQPGAQALALLDARSQNHALGEARRRQLLIQRQVETWRTSTDIGHIVVDAGLFLEQRFQAMHLGLGCTQRSALLQLDVDHQLQAPGGREELLWHEAEQQHRSDEQADGQQDDETATA